MSETLSTERGPFVDPEVIDEIAHILTRSLFEPLQPHSDESIYRMGAATTSFEVAPVEEVAPVIELGNWRTTRPQRITEAGYLANQKQVELVLEAA